jgi:NAD(P)-dependent dehydrogenase (short-subunit alcohol dehydrogenase family)
VSGKLDGKVAVITGATTGIGLATAKRFVAEGAYVFITGRRQDVLDAAVKEIGSNVTGVQGDAGNLADLDRLYEVVRREKGHIDVLYASAGVAAWVPIDAVTEQHFDSVFDVNVRGTLFTVQKALPLLKDGGAVIMTGSVADSKGFAAVSVYSASKAAVRSFARTLTTDLRHRKIRVNVLSPGYIDTAVLAPLSKADLAQVIAATPLDRLGKPEDIAKAALFLASDDSSFITGIELFVDGGAAQI